MNEVKENYFLNNEFLPTIHARSKTNFSIHEILSFSYINTHWNKSHLVLSLGIKNVS